MFGVYDASVIDSKNGLADVVASSGKSAETGNRRLPHNGTHHCFASDRITESCAVSHSALGIAAAPVHLT